MQSLTKVLIYHESKSPSLKFLGIDKKNYTEICL